MQEEVLYSGRGGSLLETNELVQTKLPLQLGEERLPIAHLGHIYQANSGFESGH